MVVNPTKTQLLCIAGQSMADISSYVNTLVATIHIQESMILLGFAFGTSPNVDEHCKLIKRKYHSRVWLLRHLKNAGIPTKDICKVYQTTMRSTIEYAAPTYHSLLTIQQAEDLEKLQMKCLKCLKREEIKCWERSPSKHLRTISLPNGSRNNLPISTQYGHRSNLWKKKPTRNVCGRAQFT